MDCAVWNRRRRPDVEIWVTEIMGEFFHVAGSDVSLLVRSVRAVVLMLLSVMVGDGALLFAWWRT